MNHDLEHTDVYSSHTVHNEMEECSVVQFKQLAVIELLTTEKVPPIKIHRQLQAVNGEEYVSMNTVRCWLRRFKDGKWGKHIRATNHKVEDL